MANDYNNDPIKNADTRARREWIESALESVRLHLDVSTFQAASTTVLESQGHDLQGHDLAREATESARPRLYLAWSDGQRRSGT